jgi:hypothetical protein
VSHCNLNVLTDFIYILYSRVSHRRLVLGVYEDSCLKIGAHQIDPKKQNSYVL